MKHTRKTDGATVIEVSRPMADDGRQMVVWRVLGSQALRVSDAGLFDAAHRPYTAPERVWAVPTCTADSHRWLRSNRAWRCAVCQIAIKRGRNYTVTHWAAKMGDPWMPARKRAVGALGLPECEGAE